MKIGIFIPNLLMTKRFEDRVFAPKELALAVADELVSRGHEVYLYAPQHTQTKAHLISFPTPLEIKDFPSQKDLTKSDVIRNNLTYCRNQNEYEIFVTSKIISDANSRNLNVLHNYLDRFGHYFAPFAKMPTLFTIHDPVFDLSLIESLKFSTFKDHHYVAISNYQREAYSKIFQLASVSTVHHGVNISLFPFTDNSAEYLCSIGRYLPVKGIDDALNVALQLKKKIIISSGADFKQGDYYKSKIEPFVNSPLVEEVEFLKPSMRNKLLSQAKAFLFPIKWEEAFGMVMIESMACGTPVIAYARGSVPEVIKDGETGFIVNSSDADIRGDWVIKKTGINGLREAIERIYTMSPVEYLTMRKKSRQHVIKNFSIEKMTDNYLQLYQELINNEK